MKTSWRTGRTTAVILVHFIPGSFSKNSPKCKPSCIIPPIPNPGQTSVIRWNYFRNSSMLFRGKGDTIHLSNPTHPPRRPSVIGDKWPSLGHSKLTPHAEAMRHSQINSFAYIFDASDQCLFFFHHTISDIRPLHTILTQLLDFYFKYTTLTPKLEKYIWWACNDADWLKCDVRL